jgi:hypothetical protein
MLPLLLLTLLIVDTIKSSELQPDMDNVSPTAPESPQKVAPPKKHFAPTVTTPTITGSLSSLKQYFRKPVKYDKILTVVYDIEAGPNTFKPQISSIDPEYLSDIDTIILCLGILSPHHQGDILGQLQQRKIKIITRC